MGDSVIYEGKLVHVGDYIIENVSELTVSVCTFVKNTTLDDHAFWKSEDTLASSPPFFLIQLSVMILMIQLFSYLLKPLRQPRFLPPLIAGIITGPTVLGRIFGFGKYVHSKYTTLVLSTLGHLSLVYYMFLAGLEMDLTAIRHIERKAKFNAIAGILIPLAMGAILFQIAAYNINTTGSLFWGISLTVTSFPDLARILSDMKLLQTDIGRMALSSATISDLASWALSVVAITFLNEQNQYAEIFFIIIFMLLCWFVGRPAVSWIIQRSYSEESKPNELLMYAIFSAVVLFGLITDALGAHSMIGGFMFGLIIPNGEFGVRLMEKLEDLVTGIMVPAFFMIHGLRFALHGVLDHGTGIFRVVLVILLCCSLKIISTLGVSKIYGMSAREGLALGALMNVKGVLALIIMNAGIGLKGFDQQTFSILTIAMVVMTLMVKPLAMASYNSTKTAKKFYRIIDQTIELDSELRVLACIHWHRNLPGLIRLLEVSNPNEQCPVCVFTTHLVQLTERRASAMLVVHDGTRYISNNTSHQNMSREEEESNHIIKAFESYERSGKAVSVEALTVVSPYDTMHEDVCSLAMEKRVTLILVPFHKQSDVDGKLQEDNASWRLLNHNILEKAPCAVGILVDRGLGQMQEINRFAMVFLGGPHDREALAYAWRMAASPNVSLTVYRFLSTENIEEDEGGSYDDQKEREKQLDDEYMNDFRVKIMQSQSITYIETEADSGEQIMRSLRQSEGYDLYIIGREQTFLWSGMEEWNTEEKELGILGDALVESDFAEQSSVLVLQQCDGHEAKGSAQRSTTHGTDHGHVDSVDDPITSWRSPFGVDHTIL